MSDIHPMPSHVHVFLNKNILICVLNFRSVEMQSQDCCVGSETV